MFCLLLRVCRLINWLTLPPLKGPRYVPRMVRRKRSRTYNTWRCMRSRCQRKTDDSYPNYGGRGITVCERWQRYEHFVEDMGQRPPGCTLDRVDVDGHYVKENCRWAKASTQSRNRRPRGKS